MVPDLVSPNKQREVHCSSGRPANTAKEKAGLHLSSLGGNSSACAGSSDLSSHPVNSNAFQAQGNTAKRKRADYSAERCMFIGKRN